MEVGIHNTTIALTIALSVLNNAEVAIAAAIYSVFMYAFAPVVGAIISRNVRAEHRAPAAQLVD